VARRLTAEENRVLELIQKHYGSQNDLDAITWTNDEAVLWVRSHSGAIPLVANLTNLASWRLDGTIASDAELKREWLQIESN
jgi:hypothetical protein